MEESLLLDCECGADIAGIHSDGSLDADKTSAGRSDQQRHSAGTDTATALHVIFSTQKGGPGALDRKAGICCFRGVCALYQRRRRALDPGKREN